MKNPLLLLSVLLLSSLIQVRASAAALDGLVIYPAVPGLAPSTQYAVRVRAANAKGKWKNLFAWSTICQASKKGTDAVFPGLAGWTHTYVNFETAVGVEIEIARVDGQPVHTAAVHPKRQSSACSVRNGKVFIRLEKPCLVAVDMDGQMDAQDTGMGFKGPPVHTLSIFANPPLTGKPNPNDPGVLTVKPGETPPSDGPWTTLYFLPGVHDLGLAFPVHANRQYYIPGDALVYGTLSNNQWQDGHHIRIFGLGTLSGARLKNPLYVTPPIFKEEHLKYHPIDVRGATDVCVEGLTLVDPAYHSIMLASQYTEGHPNEVKWAKIIGWRPNGDGINPFGNTMVEDCFIRTQDDSLYVNGLGIRRTVLWNDANGSAFVLSALPQLIDRTLAVEDCDVIYARAGWHHWSGGRVFNMRGEGGGHPSGNRVIFRNINIEDPRPTLQQFFICMTVPKPYSKETPRRRVGDLSDILFQNISIAAPSVLREPQLLRGQADTRILNLTFDNLTVAGKPVLTTDFFKTNEFVEGLKFMSGPAPKTRKSI